MKTHNFVKTSLLLATLTTSGIAVAQNIVVNGDFAHDPYPAGGFIQISSLYGWNLVGNDVAGIGVGYLGAPSQEIDLSGIYDGGGTGIVQNLATSAGTQYKLSFDVYTGGGTGNSGGVDVFVGGVQYGSDLQGLNTPNPSANRQAYTYTFSATGPSTPLLFMDNHGNVSQVGMVDAQATPEPASLFALGLPVAFLLKRRSKK